MPASLYVRANGINIHFLREGRGPPLVLLHGWPEFCRVWEPGADKPGIERERASYIEAHTPILFSFEEDLEALGVAIGRQADPLGLHAVTTRFEAVQGQATRARSVPDSHLLLKAKGWFESMSEAIG